MEHFLVIILIPMEALKRTIKKRSKGQKKVRPLPADLMQHGSIRPPRSSTYARQRTYNMESLGKSFNPMVASDSAYKSLISQVLPGNAVILWLAEQANSYSVINGTRLSDHEVISLACFCFFVSLAGKCTETYFMTQGITTDWTTYFRPIIAVYYDSVRGVNAVLVRGTGSESEIYCSINSLLKFGIELEVPLNDMFGVKTFGLTAGIKEAI